MRAVTLKATGRVQGVGFRWATKVAADKCGVNGIVRNLMDGSVKPRAKTNECKSLSTLFGSPPLILAKSSTSKSTKLNHKTIMIFG